MLDKHLIAQTQPKACISQILVKGKTRFTVLAPELLRVEVDENGKFCDGATQTVWFRDLGACAYTAEETEEHIKIKTEGATFVYNKKNSAVQEVILGGKTIPVNNDENLLGTARTLDRCFGTKELDNGIISKNGVSYFEDNTLILGEDGMIAARLPEKDTYIFASESPRRTLKLFYDITGSFPMVPRYTLGNWWSRYHRYKQQEYLDLMDKFTQQNIPFTVATVDMDWHEVFVGIKHGYFLFVDNGYLSPCPGWTGYTWNKKLFPDYKQFLLELKKRNMHTTLNLHPASGVRRFEKQYADMCKEMGLNPKKKRTIPCDFTNPKFINAYFKILHKPYENEGVSFWWIDWQQGTKSKLKGYDPLWACNHYHTLDLTANNSRPLVLSRYAGLGSHRYPLGFSGDTGTKWEVLKLLPYFTANAANVGYTDWSHDIGGHFPSKVNDDELYLRWLQFGVFSPVNRLHSNNQSISKEPWNHKSVEELAKEQLRLRHKLVPYIYTAYYNNYKLGIPLLEPLYYLDSQPEAYEYRNEYRFGSELIVAPVTAPADPNTKLSATDIWLPEGEYTDIFTGEKLCGGKHTVYRGLDSIPVFAKAGAIIPLALSKGNDCSNPTDLEVLVYSGNNEYTLYEDDGETENYKKGDACFTKFTLAKGENTLSLKAEVLGNTSLIPSVRNFAFRFPEAKTVTLISAFVNKDKADAKIEGNSLCIALATGSTLELEVNISL